MARSRTYTLLFPGCILAQPYGSIMTMTVIWTYCCRVQQASRSAFRKRNYSGMMAGTLLLPYRALCPTSGIALPHGVILTTTGISICFWAELTPQVNGV